MHTIIAYDICCSKQRSYVFRILKELGVNSQRSVFECELTAGEIRHVVNRLKECIDPKKDSLLIYPLCTRCASGVHILGQGNPLIHTKWKVI